MLGRASSHSLFAPSCARLNKSLARFNKNPFHQGFLTGIMTTNLREFSKYSLQLSERDRDRWGYCFKYWLGCTMLIRKKI